jgi:hypothetical protein
VTPMFVVTFTLVLFGGMLAGLEAGSRLAARRRSLETGEAKGLAPIEGAIFALFGLLLAFTFSGAAARFDARRDLIQAECNALGTAYLRTDLLPAAERGEVRALFRAYVDARLRLYADGLGDDMLPAELEAQDQAAAALWTRSVAAASAAPGALSGLYVAALNEAFDRAGDRMAVRRFHPPLAVFFLLLGLGLLSAFVAGWGLGATVGTRVHRTAFVSAVCLVVYVSLDLELPRRGLIRLGSADELLADTRAAMR